MNEANRAQRVNANLVGGAAGAVSLLQPAERPESRERERIAARFLGSGAKRAFQCPDPSPWKTGPAL